MSSSKSLDTNKLRLRIIQINDVYELDNFPSFCTLVKHYSSEKEAHRTLVVLAGDFLGPSLLSSLDCGAGMVDCMKHCGVTHVCFGNHETDVPMDAVVQRIFQSNFVWLNSNMRELDSMLDIDTAEYDVVTVSNNDLEKRVGLLGLLTNDPSLYRPGSFGGAKIEPVVETTEECLKNKLPKDLDLIVPLTHQSMPQDREFAKKFGGDVFPVIVGGHDHEPYDETINGSRIIKTGCDANNTAIIDIEWNTEENKKPTISVQLIPTTSFAPDQGMKRRVQSHEKILLELEKAPLFCFKDWTEQPFSTFENRLGPTNGSRILASILRMGMRATCGLINAGSIRSNKIYGEDQEWFTWQDLKSEIPFATPMVALEVPGGVLETMIMTSRLGMHEVPPVSSGGFLQTCDKIVFDDQTQTITSIAGNKFDPDKMYMTALPLQLFQGMDNHVVLLKWAEENNIHLNYEHAMPAKSLVVQVFSASLWLKLGSFEDIDSDGDGVVTRDEVKARVVSIFGEDVADLVVDNVMSVADLDGSGTITPMEVMVTQFVATDIIDHVCTHEELSVMKQVAAEVLGKHPSHDEVKEVVKSIRDVLDISGDHRIDRTEAMKALGEVQRRSLLES